MVSKENVWFKIAVKHFDLHIFFLVHVHFFMNTIILIDCLAFGPMSLYLQISNLTKIFCMFCSYCSLFRYSCCTDVQCEGLSLLNSLNESKLFSPLLMVNVATRIIPL